jgi:heterodisulfide reductase subunit A-like polyferredoxin
MPNGFHGFALNVRLAFRRGPARLKAVPDNVETSVLIIGAGPTGMLTALDSALR